MTIIKSAFPLLLACLLTTAMAFDADACLRSRSVVRSSYSAPLVRYSYYGPQATYAAPSYATPPVSYYQAPVPVVEYAPPVTYSAPVYVAPAPVVSYSAPVVTYSAPVYSAPAVSYSAAPSYAVSAGAVSVSDIVDAESVTRVKTRTRRHHSKTKTVVRTDY